MPAPQLVQADKDDDEPKVPGAQSEHDAAPDTEYFPAGHDDTAESPALGQYAPAEQESHDERPVDAPYWPIIHASHVDPEELDAVPLAQGTHASTVVEPASDDVPESHALQSELPVMLE